jgi:cell wall-associated NlpC family hydrolase
MNGRGEANVKRLASIVVGLGLLAPSALPANAHVEEPLNQRRHITRRARYWMGADYCWGGTRGCFDCSGLTYRVFLNHGARLPHSTRYQWRARHRDGWRTIENRSKLRRGDLVFFKNTYRRGISHVGIYAGRGRFVHVGDEVEVASLGTRYWTRHFRAGVRPRSLRFRS